MAEDSRADQLRELVMRVTNDNGQTFGSLVMLSVNGTVSSDVDIAITREEEERQDTEEEEQFLVMRYYYHCSATKPQS